MRTSTIASLLFAGTAALFAQGARTDRWIVILEEPPLATASANRVRMQAQRQSVHSRLAAKKGIELRGGVETVLNAVFIGARDEAIDEIRAIPGVARVVRQRGYKRQDAQAAELVKAPGAWAAVGGDQNAGAGVKIAIIDTGIDKDHPAFQDPSLAMPAGFPRCEGTDCDAYTSNKVIVARSFVELAAVPSDPFNSRPDDYSPRDRIGHGTAMASVAAGVRVKGPAAEIQGVAPKAYLGNYKIFGSPGVNDDYALDEVVLRAIEAALNDGMDVAVLAIGAPALWTVSERDTDCGSKHVGPCDPQADAIENATRRGMTVVVSAGNQGDVAANFPALGTITSPGTAPSAITVSGTTNTHILYSSVFLSGENIPNNLSKGIDAQLTTGLKPVKPITAPVVDVARLNDSGTGCQPLGNGTLKGAIALIQRGDCDFAVKLRFAQDSGAIAAVFYQREGLDSLYPIGDLRETGIPAVMIGNTAGKSLKAWIAANVDTAKVTIDPALVELDARGTEDEVAYFASRGPSLGSLAVKPELVAVGTDMYMATQSYDPNGDMFDASGYYVSQGTSFAAPQAAGAVALVKQKYPRATPGQLKSAVVNTANETIYATGSDTLARVVDIGAGKLDASRAVQTNIAVEPAVLSFGAAIRNQFTAQTLRFTNLGSSQVTLRFAVERRDVDNLARVALSVAALTLNAGQTGSITATIAGSTPRAGSYEGVIRVDGGAVPLRIPYLYMLGDGVPANIVPVEGDGFVRSPGQRVFLTFLLTDKNGVPVAGRQAKFSATSGGGFIEDPSNGIANTDGYGLVSVLGRTGNQLGYQEFGATFSGGEIFFGGRNRLYPTVRNGGFVNPASGETVGSKGIAAGSLLTITGSGLSEARQTYGTSYLPLSLSTVSVSFDDAGRKTSFPGRVHTVSDSEVTVQVPWEVEGNQTIDAKVSLGYSAQTDTVTIPLARYSPAMYEYLDASGRRVASAVDENGNPVGSENPVAAGAVLNLLVNGLGPVNNRPASGFAPSGLDATTQATPQVKIAGADAEVRYSGLAPNLPGVYLVRVVVPSGVGSGTQPIELKIEGVDAKTLNTVIR